MSEVRETKYPGYFVTKAGCVTSFWNGRWVIRKPQTGRNVNYPRTTVMHKGKRLHIPIHRLICETWHGPAPKGKPYARHLNDDRSDNRPVNLAWGSEKENSADSIKNGGQIRGEKCRHSKFNKQDVLMIRARYKAGESSSNLAREYGVTLRSVRLIVLNKTWTHI